MTNRERFTKDLVAAGFDVNEYYGRYYYHGPAVSCKNSEDFHKVLASTNAHLQWDSLGQDGWVVYPK